MKTKGLLFIFFSFVLYGIVLTQTPQVFKYQTVVRDNAGIGIANQNVSFRMSILQGGASGTVVYSETETSNTNQYGLVSLNIGGGNVIIGVFTDIDWGADTYFLQVETDIYGGNNYQLMGTSQLLSVPYSLFSQSSLSSSSLTLSSPNGTIYEVTVDDDGNIITISNCPPTITDVDGNAYNTVLLGDQCWMKENLKTTKYRNGTPIPNETNGSNWINLTTGSYRWINDDISWKDLYGGLYNWYAAIDTNGLCPMGWHVPSNNELIELAAFVGGTASPYGNQLKSCRQVNSPLGGGCSTSEHPRWDEDNIHYGTDDYGFSALPAGACLNSSFWVGSLGIWWTKTEYSSSNAYDYYMFNYHGQFFVDDEDQKNAGQSIRCIKD